MIKPCNEPGARISQETTSFSYLKKRNDFQSNYNLAVRYTFIFYLQNGFDINNNDVHKVLYQTCVNILDIPDGSVRQMIRTRHRNKYKKAVASPAVENLLSEILRDFKEKTGVY